MPSPSVTHMLDVIPFREFFYLCKASYKPVKAAARCLQNHDVSWQIMKQKDIQHKIFGSWRVTILKHTTLNEWAFTVEGTSSVRNWIANIVNQVTKRTSIITKIQKIIFKYQEKFNMQINYGMGHSAGGFLAEQAVKDDKLKNVCVMTLNSQRPQSGSNFINFCSTDDKVSAYPLSVPDRSIVIPGTTGHDINAFKKVKDNPWEKIVSGYQKPQIPSPAPSPITPPPAPSPSTSLPTQEPLSATKNSLPEQANKPANETLVNTQPSEVPLKTHDSNAQSLQKKPSDFFSEKGPSIMGSVAGLIAGMSLMEVALRWYNRGKKDTSDRWVRTASLVGGIAAGAFNIYYSKSTRFATFSTLTTSILSGVVTKSGFELARSYYKTN